MLKVVGYIGGVRVQYYVRFIFGVEAIVKRVQEKYPHRLFCSKSCLCGGGAVFQYRYFHVMDTVAGLVEVHRDRIVFIFVDRSLMIIDPSSERGRSEPYILCAALVTSYKVYAVFTIAPECWKDISGSFWI